MVFSSIVFLCGFFPLVMILYFACPAKLRNGLLFVASLIFYAWGEPIYILIMLFSTVFDYTNGRLLEYFDKKHNEGARKIVLVLSVVINIGILFFFKYTDFFITNINAVAHSKIKLLKLALPIGISFYTFQTLSYTIDVYLRKVKTQKNIISFGMYVAMFPQLIAGPIVRYKTVSNQVDHRHHSFKLCQDGMMRFLMGLGKKVILANQVGAMWDEIYAQLGGSEMSVPLAWLGAVCFTFQIYFDFSGYSDMAIGLGKMFGFYFPENFRYPYESDSITEFWRRWHITLSTWFKEYVYIPLGGNRKGFARQIFNLFIVWFLTGFWHGAEWNFILWGLYFFVILMLEKFVLLKVLKKCPKVVGHIYALLLIVFGWVIFACDSLPRLSKYVKALFGVGVGHNMQMFTYTLLVYLPFIIILIIASTSYPKKLYRGFVANMIKKKYEKKETILKVSTCAGYLYSFLILFISIALLVSGSYNPFLYFRF
ncbi:MAG: MBOAT family protein [Lachnospiraceae bacterium]|nr:MBOAT family protein [Lachnospiraceae bacterium]